MTHSSLDELVQQARRDKPGPGVLAAVARSLRVPFVAAPLAAVVLPSSAAAASAVAKLELGRAALWSWGAGSAAAVSGVAAAVMLSQPVAAPSVAAPPAPAPRMSQPAPSAKAPPVAIPSTPPVPSARRVARDLASVWDEPQLIERARKALGSDPKAALALAQEHQGRFPAGALSLEREVIVIEALARSGRPADAQRRALAFEARYPNSIHLPRIRALRERLGP